MISFLCSCTNTLVMDPKFLISSPTVSPSIASLPFCISYKSSLSQKPKLSVKTHLSIYSEQSEKTSFFGKSLNLVATSYYFSNSRKTHVPFCPIRAIVKRRKELPFDNVIQRDKKLKLVLKIQKILVSQPDRIMTLRELGKYRRALGLDKNRRFIALLRKFPGVFEIVEEGVYSLRFKLTPEAERLYLEEMKIRNEMEGLLVIKLRKLLMMSLEKRILLEKIAHLRTDLGLPLEFRDTVCHRYPQYFKVVMTGRGPALELTHWDPELAVSAVELDEEENQERDREANDLIIDRPLKFNRMKLPKGLMLSKGELRRIYKFRDIPYISPYSDFSELRSGSAEKEKHACGVIHEILSLTLEKRTLVDHLTHFREEFRFSQQLRGMLIRHPDMFYVSLKGDRDSVFLRDAYRDSHLVDKDRLLLIKEKLRSLVTVPRFPKRGGKRNSENGDRTNDEEDGSDGDEEEEWDIDELVTGDFDNDDFDEDDKDDWIDDDDDDDGPPDFGSEDGNGNGNVLQIKKSKQVDDSSKNEEKILDPIFPDGRPRERW